MVLLWFSCALSERTRKNSAARRLLGRRSSVPRRRKELRSLAGDQVEAAVVRFPGEGLELRPAKRRIGLHLEFTQCEASIALHAVILHCPRRGNYRQKILSG